MIRRRTSRTKGQIMSTERIHRAVAEDGTEICGRVRGEGSPVVFVHGNVADGSSEWSGLVPLLIDRFSCYLPDRRGRGLSGTHPDLSRETQARDVLAFVRSLEQPAALVGVSYGGMLALGAAAHTDAVAALVAREPLVLEIMSDRGRQHLRGIIAFAQRSAALGRAADGVERFLGWVANDEEAATLSGDPDGIEEFASYLPLDLEEFRDALTFEGASPTAPEGLGRIAAPTLLLRGSETALDWFTDGARYVVEHVPRATIREIDGSGHLGHLVHPQRDANALGDFLEASLQAA
jgi:pimeloyl-ACP methyl ester carboxylesterase